MVGFHKILVSLAALFVLGVTACSNGGTGINLATDLPDGEFSTLQPSPESTTAKTERVETDATSTEAIIPPTNLATSPPIATESQHAEGTPGDLTATPTLTPPVPTTVASIPITKENAHLLVQIDEIQFMPWALINALAWSPNGQILAISAGEDILLYHIPARQQLATFPVAAFTHSLAFSPDGRLLAAGSRDGFLRVWNVTNAAQGDNPAAALTIEAHKKGVNTVAFSADGSLLASGGNDAIARFWNPQDGSLQGSVVGGTFSVPGIAFMPQDSALAIVNGQVIRLRDTTSESILGTFWSENTLYSLAFRPQGDWLAAGGVDGIVRLWRPEEAFRTGRESYPDPVILAGHQGVGFRALVWQVCFSPDGELLVSAGGDSSVWVWDPQSATSLATLWGHPLGATSVAFHPQALLLASGGLDGVVRLWGIIP